MWECACHGEKRPIARSSVEVKDLVKRILSLFGFGYQISGARVKLYESPLSDGGRKLELAGTHSQMLSAHNLIQVSSTVLTGMLNDWRLIVNSFIRSEL